MTAESAADWLLREGFDLAALAQEINDVTPSPAAGGGPDLDAYDRFVVAFSGALTHWHFCCNFWISASRHRESKLITTWWMAVKDPR